jgi:hypothetical protein
MDGRAFLWMRRARQFLAGLEPPRWQAVCLKRLFLKFI